MEANQPAQAQAPERDSKLAGTRPRSVCFTLNNYTAPDVDWLHTHLRTNCTYYVLGYETGANGTPHIQGFIQLKRRLRWNSLR